MVSLFRTLNSVFEGGGPRYSVELDDTMQLGSLTLPFHLENLL